MTEVFPRPTHVEVDLGILTDNYQCIVDRVQGRPVLAVIKANAYGHGLVRLGQLYEALGAAALGVAVLEEGIALRKAGITMPILVMGGVLVDQVPLYFRYDLMLTAPSVDKLETIDACARACGVTANVHLKIDTGMERIGTHWYTAERLLSCSLSCLHISVKGVFSHLANHDRRHALVQLERFEEALDFYRTASVPTPTRHLANSAALVDAPETWLDMVRPGIALYGAAPEAWGMAKWGLRPALSWKSRVVYFKVVRKGDPVSYDGRWSAPRDTRMITVPVGYGDGFARGLDDGGVVLVGGKRYPLRGSVCMDQVLVDIGNDSAYNGDEVVLIGRQGAESVTLDDHARWTSTVTYEVLTRISDRVPRMYVGDASR